MRVKAGVPSLKRWLDSPMRGKWNRIEVEESRNQYILYADDTVLMVELREYSQHVVNELEIIAIKLG